MTAATYRPLDHTNATDAQLHAAREMILDTFEAHNNGAKWLDSDDLRVITRHKREIEGEMSRRRASAYYARIKETNSRRAG